MRAAPRTRRRPPCRENSERLGTGSLERGRGSQRRLYSLLLPRLSPTFSLAPFPPLFCSQLHHFLFPRSCAVLRDPESKANRSSTGEAAGEHPAALDLCLGELKQEAGRGPVCSRDSQLSLKSRRVWGSRNILPLPDSCPLGLGLFRSKRPGLPRRPAWRSTSSSEARPTLGSFGRPQRIPGKGRREPRPRWGRLCCAWDRLGARRRGMSAERGVGGWGVGWWRRALGWGKRSGTGGAAGLAPGGAGLGWRLVGAGCWGRSVRARAVLSPAGSSTRPLDRAACARWPSPDAPRTAQQSRRPQRPVPPPACRA